jgi:hypothetical protein
VRRKPKRACLRLEGVLHVVQLGRAPIEQDAHRIEAHAVGLERSFCEILFGEGTDRRSLAWGNGLERIAVGGAGTELDFHEDEDRTVAKDQVDLAVSRAIVALYQDETAVLEVLEREVLAPASGGAFLQGPTPA